MTDGRLRASDGDRDQVVRILDTAYAAGRISGEEHSERVEAALTARTLGALAPLTADLIPSAAPGPAPRPPGSPSSASRPVPPRRGVSETQLIRVTMDTLRRSGRWVVPPRLRIEAFAAKVELDLTEAELPGHIIDLSLLLVGSSLRLRVPSGSNVQDNSGRYLGERSIRRIGPYDENSPLILINGTITLSDLRVRGPRGQHGLLGAFGL